MWSFWRSRERFSLEELKYLNEQLERTTVVNESNKEYVIETLRSMAEILIWGDQHDASFFEFFMEKQVMNHFSRILKNSRTISVAIQLLQSLNIMIQNMRSEQAIYYLFSNEYINNLITFPLDFQNEELLAHYISFLRTISTKLNKNTVSFFVKTQNNAVVSFPLYSEAIKFAHHEESMIRIAVRTLTLNIYHVDDESIQQFIVGPPVVAYFSDVVMFLRQRYLTLVGLVTEAAKNPDSSQNLRKLEEAIEEAGDLIYYCNDIISAGVPDLSRLMTHHILNSLVVPDLIPTLCPFQATEMHVNELSSLYLLSCLLQVLNHKDLVNGIGLELLKRSSCRDESVEGQDYVGSFHCDRKGRWLNQSSREFLLSYLFCENDKLVLASLSVLVALLQNKALNETLLDALGVLPQHKRHKKLLLQALVGSTSDEEILFSPTASGQEDDFVDIDNANVTNFNSILAEEEGQDIRTSDEETSCTCDDLDNKFSSMSMGNNGNELDDTCRPILSSSGGHLVTRRNRYQVLDALMGLLCRRPPPCAEALWHAGWLLRQLLPYHEKKLRDHHLRMLNQAHLAAQEDILKEVKDCWCDLIPMVLLEDWKFCKKALETPALQKESSFVLLPNATSTFTNGDTSAFVGERMRMSVKVFVILHQLRTLVVEGSIPDNPQLGQPREPVATASSGRASAQLASVRKDIELDLIPGDAFPCRIAFERGKERSVYLLVVSKGTSGWLILAEDVPMRPSRGVIRVIAALAGSNPRVDEDHRKWLHLRIRSPHYPSSDAGKIGMGAGRSRIKKLVDGRWTLAFLDEQTCEHAKTAVLEDMAIQSSAVENVLEPLLIF
eukprot:c28628_g1_i1 orf=260-2767(+)